MINKIKNLPLMTKVLYILTFLLFIIWVLPTVNGYFSNVSKYEQSKQELESISSKYGIATTTEKFTEEAFKHQAESLFSSVEVQALNSKTYKIKISMKQEDLKKFHTMLETLALKYYVQVDKRLEFKTEGDDIIYANFTLKAL
jgi:hypothetical protein